MLRTSALIRHCCCRINCWISFVLLYFSRMWSECNRPDCHRRHIVLVTNVWFSIRFVRAKSIICPTNVSICRCELFVFVVFVAFAPHQISMKIFYFDFSIRSNKPLCASCVRIRNYRIIEMNTQSKCLLRKHLEFCRTISIGMMFADRLTDEGWSFTCSNPLINCGRSAEMSQRNWLSSNAWWVVEMTCNFADELAKDSNQSRLHNFRFSWDRVEVLTVFAQSISHQHWTIHFTFDQRYCFSTDLTVGSNMSNRENGRDRCVASWRLSSLVALFTETLIFNDNRSNG